MDVGPDELAAHRLRLVLDAAELGTYDYDLARDLVVIDRRACELFGLDPGQPVRPVDDLRRVIHPGDLPSVEEAIAEAERTHGAYSVEHRVCLADGRERWLDVHGQVLRTDGAGGSARLLGTVRDSTELRSARDQVARILEHVGDAFLSIDLEGRVTYVNTRAERVLRRSRDELLGTVIWEQYPELVGSRFEEQYQHSRYDQQTVVFEEFYEPFRIWVEVRAHPSPEGLSFYFTDVTSRRATQERTRRLQQVSAALAKALTVQEVASTVIEHAREGVAAHTAGVSVVDDDRHALRLVAGYEGLPTEVRERWSELPMTASTPLHDAVATGEPQLYTAGRLLSDYPHLSPDILRTGVGSVAVLPLTTAGAPIGTLTLGWAQPETRSEEELAFLTAIASQCAQALERATLYEQQQRIAESLQRSLLPQQLPEIPGIDLAARYLPGGAGLQVGGDWYDVLPLPDGRVAFALGDVVGKGLPAAAAMGQVRYALRAYATLDPSPAAVLSALDEFFAGRDAEELVTVLYGVLDPSGGLLVWSNAGHPPPMLLGGAEPRALTAMSDGTPLGLASPRQEATLQLDSGQTLLLYSDGLVETRQRPVGEGVDALLDVVRLPARGELEADALCERVLADLLGGADAADDATLLALRWTGAGDALPGPHPSGARRHSQVASTRTPRSEPHVASTRLRPEALAASTARRFLRAQLERWQLLELSDVAELCISELVTNAVLHARTAISVGVRAGSGALRVEVCDSGGARVDLPPLEQPAENQESGRGLFIVQTLSTRMGVESESSGTCVWFELPLPGGAAAVGAELTGVR